MLIRSLELENIRSYKRANISLPSGIVLLAGDIGAGKSTVLLAAEFALFGLRGKELSGTSLLRHGCNHGLVKLAIEVDGREVVIERRLKKTSNGVGQDAGSITIDGETRDLSAIELKSKVLEILNYPDTLLTQNKSLVFRYTVYTPQEQMKGILFEKAEERLDTLRKLFGIDKYKTARENAATLGRELNKEVSRLKGRAEALDETRKECETLKQELFEAQQKESGLAKAQEEEEEKLAKARKEYERYEQQREEYQTLEQAHKETTSKCREYRERLERLSRELTARERELKEYEGLDEEDIERSRARLKKLLDENEAAQEDARKKLDENIKNEATIQAHIKRHQKDAQDVKELEECPTCQQQVPEEHKERIRASAEQKVTTINERLAQITRAKERLEQKLQGLREEGRRLRQESEELFQQSSKMRLKKRVEEDLNTKREEQAALQKSLSAQERTLEEQTTKLRAHPLDKEALEKAREVVRHADEAYQQARLALARHQERTTSLKEQAQKLQERLKAEEQSQRQAQALSRRHEWLTKDFTNTLYTIEKHVLMTLYHQFNESFKEWFDTLIEDDTITVRLGHDFSPLVEQDGYETEILNLSGGEKTAVALAYRLALNKTVNQALEHLKTDGLLVLDEPTDGFSSEQLDRVQEVLSLLNLDQVIIVSHEQKMQAFVDHIITIAKREHESEAH